MYAKSHRPLFGLISDLCVCFWICGVLLVLIPRTQTVPNHHWNSAKNPNLPACLPFCDCVRLLYIFRDRKQDDPHHCCTLPIGSTCRILLHATAFEESRVGSERKKANQLLSRTSSHEPPINNTRSHALYTILLLRHSSLFRERERHNRPAPQPPSVGAVAECHFSLFPSCCHHCCGATKNKESTTSTATTQQSINKNKQATKPTKPPNARAAEEALYPSRSLSLREGEEGRKQQATTLSLTREGNFGGRLCVIFLAPPRCPPQSSRTLVFLAAVPVLLLVRL
jgi:hypothetical protein